MERQMPENQPINLSRIKQIAIPVHSIDEAKRFYRDTLGMRHLFDAPPALAFFDCGGVQLMLAGPDAQGKDGEQQHPVLFYDVGDIKKTHAKIISSGARSLEEPHVIARMNGREIWISALSDGQGNTVSLMSDVPETGIV
jgi:methylmalonyl-CoA/ethylmalonyl-CoA epimerase